MFISWKMFPFNHDVIKIIKKEKEKIMLKYSLELGIKKQIKTLSQKKLGCPKGKCVFRLFLISNIFLLNTFSSFSFLFDYASGLAIKNYHYL